MKLTKSDFNAGSPDSCWLREEVCAEIDSHLYGVDGRGLIKKHQVYVDEDTKSFVMDMVKSLDDYPSGLRMVAVDIIREELDPTFEKAT